MGSFDCGGLPPEPGPPGGIGGIENAAGAFGAQILLAIIDAVRSLWNWVAGIATLVGKAFNALGKFLLHIWQKHIKKAITDLFTHVKKLREWLKRTIPPIIKRLETIKKWYDTHVLKQQLRMLQQIQMVRRFLGILRIFHVKWAAKIDGTLADLQNRIEQSISIVRGTLNQIVNTLALMLDPTLVLTRNLLGASLLSNLGAVKRIFGFGDGRILSASEQTTIDRQHSLYFASTVKAHLQTLSTSGPTADDKANRTAARLALTEATNAPLPF
jgi:hypothetical protein